MSEPLSMPAPAVVRTAIDDWRKLDRQGATDADIDASLRSFLDRVQWFTVTMRRFHGIPPLPFGIVIPSGVSFFRVRHRHHPDGRPTNWPWSDPSDLLYRKAPCIREHSRCNAPGEQVLYCASDVVTALRETNTVVGCSSVVIHYQAVDFSLVAVPGSHRTHDIKGLGFFDAPGAESHALLRAFVREEFTRATEVTPAAHRISSALCRTWFADSHASGWMYESVRSQDHECVALKRLFVESERFEVKGACSFDVESVTEKGFLLRRTHTASIGQQIEWHVSAGRPTLTGE